jgi:trimethylguanosine synthase
MKMKLNKNKCPFGPKMQRYWVRRYDLFSRFDKGIQIDEVGLYSVTPEDIALQQAKRFKCKTILDGFCGVGGNAIAFARLGMKVTAIEKDKTRFEMARHNAEVYGVADKIVFILGDFLFEAPKIKADGVFVDLEWGGPAYKEMEGFKLNNFSPDGSDILDLSFKYFEKVAIKVPDFFDFKELEKFGKKYEVQDNMINGEVGFRTVYFG